ncbi:UNVERIFIED_ORG: hypothetical protein M2414_005372 [Rahnella aquatilis]
MTDLSKNNLLYIKLQDSERYLSCNTDTTSPSLILSETPYPWEVKGNRNSSDIFSGSIMTLTEKYPTLFVQVNSLSLDSDKNYYDAILSQINKYALRIIKTPHPTTSSVSIYLVDGNTSREYYLGRKDVSVIFFS